MDHRLSLRKKSDIGILIYVNGIPVALGHLVNISRDGAFVLCQSGQFTPNQCIKIEAVNWDETTHGRSIKKCFVTRVDSKGFGLEFFHELDSYREIVPATNYFDDGYVRVKDAG